MFVLEKNKNKEEKKVFHVKIHYKVKNKYCTPIQYCTHGDMENVHLSISMCIFIFHLLDFFFFFSNLTAEVTNTHTHSLPFFLYFLISIQIPPSKTKRAFKNINVPWLNPCYS